jgi:hypothetical protein
VFVISVLSNPPEVDSADIKSFETQKTDDSLVTASPFHYYPSCNNDSIRHAPSHISGIVMMILGLTGLLSMFAVAYFEPLDETITGFFGRISVYYSRYFGYQIAVIILSIVMCFGCLLSTRFFHIIRSVIRKMLHSCQRDETES